MTRLKTCVFTVLLVLATISCAARRMKTMNATMFSWLGANSSFELISANGPPQLVVPVGAVQRAGVENLSAQQLVNRVLIERRYSGTRPTPELIRGEAPSEDLILIWASETASWTPYIPGSPPSSTTTETVSVTGDSTSATAKGSATTVYDPGRPGVAGPTQHYVLYRMFWVNTRGDIYFSAWWGFLPTFGELPQNRRQ